VSNPERIHITWNAADGWERFNQEGIENTHKVPPTPGQITTVLAAQVHKLFALSGWVEDSPNYEVSLHIHENVNDGLAISNRTQPPFKGIYKVSPEPPPSVTVRGDYVFDLIEASQQGLM
jgi:hypothetical protein